MLDAPARCQQSMNTTIQFTAKVDKGKIIIPEEYIGLVSDSLEIEVIIKPRQSRLMDRLAEQPLTAVGWRDLTRDDVHEKFNEQKVY
jgi:hypothetical protein